MPQRYLTFRSCLLGMAVGDAMGYSVDARSLAEIRSDYGPEGLLGYDLVNGCADVSSYTQLAAFAANGLLLCLTRQKLRGQDVPPLNGIALAIREWARSQHYCEPAKNHCWLSTLPVLKRRRCMDTWMLTVLSGDRMGTPQSPINRSDHPAALTEAIPIAMLAKELGLNDAERNSLAARAVALTHGNRETFISGAFIAHLLGLILADPKADMETMLDETISAVSLQFGSEFPQISKVWELLQLARTLAVTRSIAPAEAMERLGCRTGPEVLAGVVYTLLTCEQDFDGAMITAVNHSGRSAAVGALTGALLGSMLGLQALPEFYLESLEAGEALTELAYDMRHSDSISNIVNLFDDEWDRKYLHGGL